MKRHSIAVIVGTCLVAAAACGGEDDGEDGRRPFGDRPSAQTQGELPEGHPDIPGMGEGAPGGTVERDLPPTVTVHLDSGNAAYRSGDYESARRHFRAAAREDSSAGAAWFGVYMAERALGNELAADSALQKAGDLGDASGMHGEPEGSDADTALPHPPMDISDS